MNSEQCTCINSGLFPHRKFKCALSKITNNVTDPFKVNTKKPMSVTEATISNESIDMVIIGGGPVGLYFAKEYKSRKPDANIMILERYETYSRHHYVKIEKHFLNTNSSSHVFFRLASSVTPLAYSSTISPTKTMSILDLENKWKQEAYDLGIQFKYEKVTDCLTLESIYPNAKLFIGADGSKSIVRQQLFGKEKSIEYDFQYMIELKYNTIEANAKELSKTELYMTRKVLNSYVSEFIRNEQTIIARFLVKEEIYNNLPECSFKAPLKCQEIFQNLNSCKSLQEDILVYLNIRKYLFNEQYDKDSAIITKVKLGIYKSAVVALKPSIENCNIESIPISILIEKQIMYLDVISKDIDSSHSLQSECDSSNTPCNCIISDKVPHSKLHCTVQNIDSTEINSNIIRRGYWFLIGDATMGVPFYRSLNAGLEAATKLIDMLTDIGITVLGQDRGFQLAVLRHSTFYSLISFREGTEAFVKSEGIDKISKAYTLNSKIDDMMNKININTSKWDTNLIESFKNTPHEATIPS